jgi:2OG-Fe(II) oxygenase superfamily
MNCTASPAIDTTSHDSQTPQDWPSHWAVAHMPGSLPMGGVVPMTPIHAFSSSPRALQLKTQTSLKPVRTDIELGGLLAFEISDLMTAEEADAIVTASELMGYRDEAPGINTPPGMRMNKSVHWVADDRLLNPLMSRMLHLLPSAIDGQPLYGLLSQRLNMYRYDANDVFNRHVDGEWPGYSLSEDRSRMLQWGDSVRSGLTMILYLNGPEDGVSGGCTRLFRRDGSWVDVSPRKGSALFFRHGFGPHSVVHEGRQVGAGVSKYVARINIMYGQE